MARQALGDRPVGAPQEGQGRHRAAYLPGPSHLAAATGQADGASGFAEGRDPTDDGVGAYRRPGHDRSVRREGAGPGARVSSRVARTAVADRSAGARGPLRTGRLQVAARARVDLSAPRGARRGPAPRPPGKEMPLWQEMPLLLTVAFCLAVLIRTFLVQAFFIPSSSMENTLLIGDRVLVNKMVYDMRGPQRGEVVVFSGTDSWLPEVPPEPDLGLGEKFGRTVGDLVGVTRPGDKDFIKRIIGLPGDRVSCCDAEGRVLVNGVPLDEPYVFQNSPLNAPAADQCRGRRFDEVVVGQGQMLVMGDHRLVSLDGRCQGMVPVNNVIGKAMVVVWPTRSWRVLHTPSTFDVVPTVAGAPPAVTGRSGRSFGAPASSGTAGIVLPLVLTWAVSRRTGRKFPAGRRRLSG